MFYARPRFCTDNGAMIAYAGCQRPLAGQHDGPSDQRPAALADGVAAGGLSGRQVAVRQVSMTQLGQTA